MRCSVLVAFERVGEVDVEADAERVPRGREFFAVGLVDAEALLGGLVSKEEVLTLFSLSLTAFVCKSLLVSSFLSSHILYSLAAIFFSSLLSSSLLSRLFSIT